MQKKIHFTPKESPEKGHNLCEFSYKYSPYRIAPALQLIFPWLLFLFVVQCVCDITLLVVLAISGQQGKLQGLKVFQRKGADTSRDTKREEDGEYSDSKFGPLIVGVLLIHRDTINSPKSSQWVRRGEDSEAGRCRRKSIDPKTPGCPRSLHHADQGLTVRPSAGALQQTHTHSQGHTHTEE